jgi:secondary thiamine-phosphate synthase enzyme
VDTLTFQTQSRQQLLDITDAVRDTVSGVRCEALLLYCPHTTAGLVINEHADPDVARDLLLALDEVVPEGLGYRHGEGNSPAHVKATLVGSSQVIPMQSGRLVLGTWQGIFLAEFDGPRRRQVVVTPLGLGSTG